jgi:hypothetical protein
VTLAFFEWCNSGKKSHQESLNTPNPAGSVRPPVARPQRKSAIIPMPLGPEFPKPQIAAADPVRISLTAKGYQSFYIPSLQQRHTKNGQTTIAPSFPLNQLLKD